MLYCFSYHMFKLSARRLESTSNEGTPYWTAWIIKPWTLHVHNEHLIPNKYHWSLDQLQQLGYFVDYNKQFPMMILTYLDLIFQCSNIFLTKDNDIRLGKEVWWISSLRIITSKNAASFGSSQFTGFTLIAFLSNTIFFWNAGDFGLAKLLSTDDLASSV